METTEKLKKNLNSDKKILKRKGNPNPVCNLPKHYMQKGAPPQPGAGRPKKTPEQRLKESEEAKFANAIKRLQSLNLMVLEELMKDNTYIELFIKTLESGARNGNPSALKFLNEILGNVVINKNPKEVHKIEVKLVNQFS